MARTNLESFRLKERCSIKSSKRIFAREYVDFGIPFWRSKDVIDKSLGVFDSFDLYISKERFGEIADKFGSPRKNDLLISSVGNRAGQPYVVQDEGDFYFKDGNILWVSEFENLDPEFLAYWLKSSNGQLTLSSIMIGSAQKALTIDALRNLEVSMPSYSAQLNAVKSLKLLDCKIALNRQINKTLEQMAQALFKSWFVDFDPVIDNALDAGFFEQDLELSDELLRRAETRKAVRESADFKPLPENIRQLFPAAFEECSEPSLGLGGWVPNGWSIKCVSKAISINPKVSLAKNTIAKFVDMKALPTTGYSIEEVIEKPFTGGIKFKQDDVLLARITPCLQNGKTGIVDFLSDNEAGFGSTEFIILRGNKNIHYSYIACLARHEQFRQHVMQSMVGSSGRQRVQNGCFDNYQIAVPCIEVMNSFASLALPSFKKLKENTNESITLSRLRDTLLPKFISGELRLSDSEVDTADEVLA